MCMAGYHPCGLDTGLGASPRCMPHQPVHAPSHRAYGRPAPSGPTRGQCPLAASPPFPWMVGSHRSEGGHWVVSPHWGALRCAYWPACIRRPNAQANRSMGALAASRSISVHRPWAGLRADAQSDTGMGAASPPSACMGGWSRRCRGWQNRMALGGWVAMPTGAKQALGGSEAGPSMIDNATTGSPLPPSPPSACIGQSTSRAPLGQRAPPGHGSLGG